MYIIASFRSGYKLNASVMVDSITFLMYFLYVSTFLSGDTTQTTKKLMPIMIDNCSNVSIIFTKYLYEFIVFSFITKIYS